jgi:hypothetical protein
MSPAVLVDAITGGNEVGRIRDTLGGHQRERARAGAGRAGPRPASFDDVPAVISRAQGSRRSGSRPQAVAPVSGWLPARARTASATASAPAARSAVAARTAVAPVVTTSSTNRT